MGKPPEFLPIVYGEFYDVPRVLIVIGGDERLLLDCPFDPASDEFSTVYRVYRMPNGFAPPSKNWEGLFAEALEELAPLAVTVVTFDATKRRAVEAATFRGMFTGRTV